MSVLTRARELAADPNRASMVIGAVLIVAGFVTIGLTWGAVAARLEVPLQVPYLISGSFASLGLIAVGLTVINVQVARRLNALRRRQLDALLDGAASRAAEPRR